MGVRGLTTYVLGLPGPKRRKLAPNTTILIDGHGWAFSLSDRVALTLGPYGALDALARREVAAFRAAGLRVIVFFDGRSKNHKTEASWRRQKQTAEQWESIRSALLDGAALTDFPSGPLIVEQLRGTLRSLNVEVRECVSEADFDLCHAALDESDAIIFANDSDFFVVRGVQYAPFSSISASETDGVSAVIWTRRELASKMGISEHALVEIALLLGNDFTGQYIAIDYDNLSENAVAALASLTRVESLREAAIEENWDEHYQVRPKAGRQGGDAAFGQHAAALLFARTFYSNDQQGLLMQLEGNVLAPIASRRRQPRLDELLDIKGLVPRDCRSPEGVPELVKFLRERGPVTLGELAMKWLEVLMRKGAKKRSAIPQRCLRALSDVVRNGHRSAPPPAHPHHGLAWEDIRLSMAFQMICRDVSGAGCTALCCTDCTPRAALRF
eukprot:scaffold2048_cov224-Pinguiococcus_pyrenoidosus.AAC.3